MLAGLAAAVATASRPNAIAICAACAVAAWIAWRRHRDWRAWIAPALSPLGAVAFQLFLWARTGEPGVWFRVQDEAWSEGVSFGWTALRRTYDAVASPFGSATNVVTRAVRAGHRGRRSVALVKARLPAPIVAYTARRRRPHAAAVHGHGPAPLPLSPPSRS